MSAYHPGMKIRALFSMFVAAAMLFAPAASAAHVMAAAADHHMQMAEMGYCQSPPAGTHGSDQDKAPVKNCCMAMCMAMAIEPAQPAEWVRQAPSPTYFAAPEFWHGFIGEIATPPPRRT